MYTWKERKQMRVDHYNNNIHGWKQKICTACNGSGYYDHDNSPECSSCAGTGKETYPGEKSIKFNKGIK